VLTVKQVRVKIVEARQLAGANISSVCRIECHKQTAQTRIKHSTNSPFWNEMFFFSFRLPAAQLFDDPLQFEVRLKATFISDRIRLQSIIVQENR